MYFLLFVLNQCKMLVADWRHRGSGSVKVIGSVLVNQFSRALPGWSLGEGQSPSPV